MFEINSINFTKNYKLFIMKKTTILATIMLLISFMGNSQTDIWTSDSEDNLDWDLGGAWITDNQTNVPGAGMIGTFFWGAFNPGLSGVLTSPSFFIDAGFTDLNFEMRIVDVVVPVVSIQHSSYNVYIYDTAVNTTDDFNGSKTQILSGTVNQTIPSSYIVSATISNSFAGKTVGLFIEGISNSTSLSQVFLVDDFKVSSSQTLSTQNNTIENLSFFPNPVADTITLQTLDNLNTVVVYNLAGQRLLTFNKTELTTKTIDLSNLQTGIYILDVNDVNDKTGKIKVIVQ